MAGISLDGTGLRARHAIVDAGFDDMALDALQRLRNGRRRARAAWDGNDQTAVGLALVEPQKAEDIDILVGTEAVRIRRHLDIERLDARIEMNGMAPLGIVELDRKGVVEAPFAVAGRQHENGHRRQRQEATRQDGACACASGLFPASHGFTPLSG